MLEQSERFERDATFVTAFPPIPYCVAGGLMAAVAMPWMIAATPALNVATILSGWAGEVALAIAILAATILLAALGLAVADWWAETKSRRDWATVGKAANLMPAPVGAAAPSAEVYATAAYVNAGAKLHWRAGAKIHHHGEHEGPRYRGPSCFCASIGRGDVRGSV